MIRPSIIKPLLILTSMVIVLAAMQSAASFLVPILLALFFAILLSPIYRWLKQHRVPGILALLLTIGVLVLVAVFLVLLVGNSLTTLTTSLASYDEQISQRQEQLASQVAGMDPSSILKQAISAIDPATMIQLMGFILSVMASLFKNGFLILFVTLFVLTEGPQFKIRMMQAFGPDHFLTHDTLALVTMVINYFGLRALVNLVTAVSTGIMLWLLGIPDAGLWSVMIFFFSFIPYIGAFFAMIPPVLLAYAQGGLGLALVVIVMATVINSLTENIVAPMVMGKGLKVSPTVVFLSFIFWMFILGGPGALIAMPLTVGLILFMGSFSETRSLAAMLANFPEPTNKP